MARPPKLDRELMRDPNSHIEALIENLLASGELEIFDNVNWKLRDGYLGTTLTVQHPQQQPDIRLELRKNPRISKFSIQLRVSSKPARRYCSRMPHTNPSDCANFPNMRFVNEHKHKWSDITGDECVYIPEDFNTDPLEEAFLSFCEECGITFHGVWNEPPEVQMGFETIA